MIWISKNIASLHFKAWPNLPVHHSFMDAIAHIVVRNAWMLKRMARGKARNRRKNLKRWLREGRKEKKLNRKLGKGYISSLVMPSDTSTSWVQKLQLQRWWGRLNVWPWLTRKTVESSSNITNKWREYHELSSWIWIREEKSWWDRLYINVHSTHAEWSEKYIWPTFDAWSPVCHTVSVRCDPEADERLDLLLCQGMRWNDRCDGWRWMPSALHYTCRMQCLFDKSGEVWRTDAMTFDPGNWIGSRHRSQLQR
jgi:hypothetical protein